MAKLVADLGPQCSPAIQARLLVRQFRHRREEV